MDRVTLEALALRAEQAEGPDRALDRDIADATGLGPDETWERPRSDAQVKRLDEGSWIKANRIRDSARHTGSLDAAMMLVGDEHWRVEDHPMAGPCAVVGDQEGYAATAVLAFVAAALRNRAAASLAREPGEGDRHG